MADATGGAPLAIICGGGSFPGAVADAVAARDDIIPFGFALGQTGALVGLNVVGLRRRGVADAYQPALRRAYRLLFFTDGRLAERIETLAREFADDPLVGRIVAFVRAGAKRPLMRPRARGDAAGGDPEG